MNITFASNGWTPIISGLDLADITQEQVHVLECIVGTQTLAVIKNQQHLTIDDEVKFLKMFGSVDINKPEVKNVVIDGSDRILRRVTGKRRVDGSAEGLFGNKKELGWHANPVEDPERRSVVYLRGISGTKNSITSFTNHARAWNLSLPKFLKDYLIDQNLHTVHEHDHTTNDIATETMLDLYGTTYRPSMYDPNFLPTMVYKNIFGTTGLYFSWSQFTKFKELDLDESKKIRDILRLIVLNDQKNIYDHHWTNGDVILSDQWLGLHKRHAFEQIEDRLLHRGVVEYSGNSLEFLEKTHNLLNNQQ
jgi:alpha-ketoglutarate-dependent taurine dioxygenase